MQRAALFLARFCSSAWIGAATLFVIVGVREVTQGGFDAATKDTLVALRFPIFYFVGAILVGASLLGTCLAVGNPELSGRRRAMAFISLVAVLGAMAGDYIWIYKPLEAMVLPPGQAKPSTFVQYHEASKYVNLVSLTFCLIAAVALNWPKKHTAPTS